MCGCSPPNIHLAHLYYTRNSFPMYSCTRTLNNFHFPCLSYLCTKPITTGPHHSSSG
jgi:hypothetical protein